MSAWGYARATMYGPRSGRALACASAFVGMKNSSLVKPSASSRSSAAACSLEAVSAVAISEAEVEAGLRGDNEGLADGGGYVSQKASYTGRL